MPVSAMYSLAVVVTEAQAVGLERLVRDLGDRARLAVDAVDRLLHQRPRRRGALRQPVAFVFHQRAVARVGEPDRAVVRVHDRVVRRVELLALEFVGEHRHLAGVLVAHDPAGAVLAGDLPALVVERVAVGVAGRIAEAPRDVAVFLEPAQILVVRDVAPQQVAADRAPGRSLGPQRAGVQPLDRRVAELVLEALVEHDDVGVGVAHGLGARAEITRERLRRHRGGGGERGRGGEEAAAVDAGRGRPLLRLGKVDEPVELNTSHRFLLLFACLGRTPAAHYARYSSRDGRADGPRMIPRVINRLKPLRGERA